MEKIRKGNDIVILWDIFKIEDGAEVPYDLTGKNLTLYLNNAVEKVKVSDFLVSENTVRMVFWGKEQKNNGIYSLTLVENEGREGMHTVDECDAFTLVPRSCLAGGSHESKVDIVTLKFRGTMMVGGGVVDDHLSDTSWNAVMNRVVTEELNRKAYAEDVPQRLSQLTDDVGLVTIEDVPTKVSYLENDADYTKKEYVDSQINYLYFEKASKADLARKQDVLRAGTGIVINGNTIYCTLDTSVFKVVSHLPETGELQKIYLVPSDFRGEKNIYKEYAYIGNKWEVIGEFTSDIDLSEYAKKEDIHTPDWNAAEGEEGHIKNRTHYADFVEVDIPEDIASSEVELTIPNIAGVPILVHYARWSTSKYLKISPDDQELHVLSYGPAFKIRRGGGNEIFISGHNDENHRLYIATHFVALNEIFLPETIARKSEMATINGQPLTEGGDIVIEGGKGEKAMVSVTYAELVELRDNGELVPGMQYRITDYVTTTAQENTRSAGHQFDIIVTADDEKTLNEIARACKSEFDIEKYKDVYNHTSDVKMLYVGIFNHDGKEYHLYEADNHVVQMLVDFNTITIGGFDTTIDYPYISLPSYTRWNNEGQWTDWFNGEDEGESICFKYDPVVTYFNTSNLAAWQIWYSLDNDAERFAWATVDAAMKVYDAEDDSSLIYKRHKLHDTNLFAWAKVINSEDSEFGEVIDWDNLDDSDLIFTESEYIALGLTLIRQGYTSVKVVDIQYGKGVIYRMIDEWNNDCPYDFKNIQFNRGVYDDGGIAPNGDEDMNFYLFTFSFRTENNEIIDTSIFGNNGRLLNDEVQIAGVYGNVIGQYVSYDGSIDSPTKPTQRLNDIVFYSHYDFEGETYYGCYSNNFGDNCSYNSFGNNCNSNSFGNDCSSNSFGDYCNYNSFGDYCGSNSFGNGCSYNSFGNNCNSNSFGNDCGSLELNESTSNKTASVNSSGEAKVFNLADLADLLNS